MDKAIFAGGCFWGVEALMQGEPGVTSTTVGYTGGHKADPSYDEVCAHGTGHFEAVEIEFDPQKTSYEKLLKLFFEIHDFTQKNGQGPDLGEQYLSKVFYLNDEQKETAEKVIQELKDLDYDVATELLPATKFWPAEEYHQDYYSKTGKEPYCHFRRKIFTKL